MKPKQAQQVRIIAGRWRGRKLAVPAVVGLRPTPDRIRETLFNWLAAKCPGSNVLDCFAGSGALGLEALSRGARHITMIDQDLTAWKNLQCQITRFDADQVSLLMGEVVSLIPELPRSYDVVFIDPPYASPQLRALVLDALILHEKLNHNAVIYLEWSDAEKPGLATGMSWLKQKKAGQINYAIAEWELSG